LQWFYTNWFCLQVISVMSMWTRMQPAYAANMWNEALNKRLGTEVVAFIYVTHFTVYGYLFNISLNSKPYCFAPISNKN
jgi:hypothetical protein